MSFRISFFAFLSFSLAPLRGQVGTASLAGLVTDPTGASVVNATVTLESITQKYSRSTVTGAAGEYKIPALPPGEYKLVIQASGFQTATETGVSLSSGQASTLGVTLALAGTSEQVTVSEAPPLLQTESATLGTTIPGRHVTELPIL